MNSKFLLDCSIIERILCSIIERMKKDLDYFEVLRKIKKTPSSSQRELAEELGFSLGKLNYCLKALQKKGFGGNNVFIKTKNLEINLSFKGDDLKDALNNGKGKGKVVMAGVKTND